MRKTSFALALLTAAVLSACGGSSSTAPRAGNQTPLTKFSNEVTFGDSLSDVGSYAVGTVATLGGGKYTINGNNTSIDPELTGRNWNEVIAAQLNLPAPCAAQTGLNGDASKNLSVAVTFHANCFNFAQGGARVSDPVGPGNAATGSALGATTVPVVTQIANYLTRSGGKFSGTELVTVIAGGNDVLAQLTALETAAAAAGQSAGAKVFASSLVSQLAAGAPNPATAAQSIGLAVQTAAASGAATADIVKAAVTAAAMAGNTAAAQPGVYGPMVATAQAAATAAGQTAGAAYATAQGPALVTALGTAGATMAAAIKTQIVAKGAKYVVVAALPDVASSPVARAESADTQKLVAAMVDAFNKQLVAGIGTDPAILYVDLYTISHDQVANPAPYGLTNTSTPACGANALGTTSLVCTKANVIAGDVSHYMFADDIHPTPFEHALIARYVLEQMSVKGWL